MKFTIKTLAVVLILAIAGWAHAAAPDRLNVLFICVDDLKPLLGCYGDPLAKTPNIDQFAQHAVRFDAAYCNQAVCAPSRNSLMTGLRPTSVGVYDLGTNFRFGRPDAVTMGQYFKSHGWRTESLGKVFHVGHGNHDDAPSWSVPHWTAKTPGYVLPKNRTGGKGPAVECADVPDEAYADGQTAAEAIRRLQSAQKWDEPFFLMVGFVKPHLPFTAPKRYWDLYDRSSFHPNPLQTPPAGAPAFAPTNSGELHTYTDIPNVGPISDAQQCELIHGYYAAASYTDAQIGKVLTELDRLGLRDKTIIVLWGDHGWHLGDHGLWAKHDNYEQATRIPLLLSVPGLTPPGTVCKGLVESVDLYPTLCQVTGLPSPQGLDGQSFAPALKDPENAKTREAAIQVYPRTPKGMGWILGRSVRTDRYRLVEWKAPGASSRDAILELYDYQSDPAETRNHAADQPEVVASLRKFLDTQPEARPQVKQPAAKP